MNVVLCVRVCLCHVSRWLWLRILLLLLVYAVVCRRGLVGGEQVWAPLLHGAGGGHLIRRLSVVERAWSVLRLSAVCGVGVWGWGLRLSSAWECASE